MAAAGPGGSTGARDVDACLQKNQQILQILYADELHSADVADFQGTVQQVDMILRGIASGAFYTKCAPTSLSLKIFLKALEKLSSVLDEYVGKLVQLHQGGQLVTTLNNVNGRRRLEQLNGSLMMEAQMLGEKHAYLGRETGELSGSQGGETGAGAGAGAGAGTDYGSPMGGAAVGGGEAGDRIKINDAAAKAMWMENLDGEFMVPWTRFVEVFTGTLNTTLSKEQRAVVKQILDNNNTGFVSAAKFNEFLRGFGPFHESLKNVDRLLAQPWFFGFMSMDEARKFLDFQPTGTFLVRFSGTKPGSFALAFTSGVQRVQHVHITTTESGFSVKQQDEEKVFNDLYEIVRFYNTVLTSPFRSLLPYEPWFHGEIDSATAESYLTGKKVGTFLIRFSSQPQFFAGSYVDEQNNVGKCLIASSPRFYIADQEGAQFGQFDTMSDLVHAFNTIFKFPYRKGTNDKQEQMRERIAKELLETEKTYARALRTMDTVFMAGLDPSLPANSKILSTMEYRDIFTNVRDLATCHERMTGRLEPIISDWGEDSIISGAMLEFNREVDVYTPYVNGYTKSMAVLNRCMARPPFKKAMDALMSKPEVDQNNYTAYSIQPIQRLPRYILLLSDLLKHTPDDHVDFQALTEALDAIKVSADEINTRKGVADNLMQLQEMNERLMGSPDFKPVANQSVVHEGDVQEREGKKWADRYVWLLTEFIMVGKPAKAKKKDTMGGPVKCTFKEKLLLRGCQVVDIPDGKSDKNQFKVVAGSNEMTFCSAQPGHKAMWMTKIKQAVEDLANPSREPIKRSSTMTIVSRFGANTRPGLPEGMGAGVGGASPASSPGGPGPGLPHGGPVRSPSLGAFSGMPPSHGVSGSPPPAGRTPPSFASATGSPAVGRAGLSQSMDSAAPGLPPGWKEAKTAEGRTYYFHVATKQTSWQRPGPDSAGSPAPGSPASVGSAPGGAAASPWKQAVTADGKSYWYHTVTKATSWTRPPDA